MSYKIFKITNANSTKYVLEKKKEVTHFMPRIFTIILLYESFVYFKSVSILHSFQPLFRAFTGFDKTINSKNLSYGCQSKFESGYACFSPWIFARVVGLVSSHVWLWRVAVPTLVSRHKFLIFRNDEHDRIKEKTFWNSKFW